MKEFCSDKCAETGTGCTCPIEEGGSNSTLSDRVIKPAGSKVVAMNKESAATNKAMDGLIEIAESWGGEIEIDKYVDNIVNDKKMIRAMLIQSFIEGAYRGRMSHKEEAL